MTENDKKAEEIVLQNEIWPNKITLPPRVESHEFKDIASRDSQLDLTWFSRVNTGEPRPAIIFVHGGSWKAGDKKQFYRQAAYLAEKYNIFGVCIEYRLSGIAKYPGGRGKTRSRSDSWACSPTLSFWDCRSPNAPTAPTRLRPTSP